MIAKDLSKYENWKDRHTAAILFDVIQCCGWENVFPPGKFANGIPLWAHRLRNWFNESPRTLSRLDDAEAELAVNSTKKFEHKADCQQALQARRDQKIYSGHIGPFPGPRPPHSPTVIDEFAELIALSGDVYLDEVGRTWFQMTPLGAIYHYDGPPQIDQHLCPVFKLVSPDGTGGSKECVIKNPLRRQSVPGWNGTMTTIKVGKPHLGEEPFQPVDVSRLIEMDRRLRGSYNYGDTAQLGMSKHELYDMKPDEKVGPASYIDPPPNSTLTSRVFPATYKGQELAEQDDFQSVIYTD